MSSLSQVHLPVPPSPGLEVEGHSTLAAHVTEGTLARSRGTGTTDSGNTGNGSTCAPGLSRVLHTGTRINSVGLSGVSGQVVVHELHYVCSQGSVEHWGHPHVCDLRFFVFVVEYGNCGSIHRLYNLTPLIIQAF